jgi:competence protein ComEC
LRRAAAAGLDRSIPAPEAGLAAGILTGLRDRVDRDLASAFTTAGVSHIVAISGWNIAIVATTLGALTGRLGRRRRSLASAAAIALYVAFVGPSPSVVRAAAMAGCALLARELGRPAGAASAMGLAVAGLLLVDPRSVDDPGFRLSVLATAGLIAWGTPLSRRLAGRAPGRLHAWVAESLGVSLAAQAATLPVILVDFGRLSLVSPAVNLVVAPLVAPAMAAGAVALVAGVGTGIGLPAGLAVIVGLPAWALLGVIVGVVRGAAAMPLASVTLDEPLNAVAAGVAAAVVAIGPHAARLALSRRRRPRAAGSGAPARTAGRVGKPATGGRTAPTSAIGRSRASRITALLLGASTLAVAVAAIHRPDGATRITVLDVGQGDAILLEGGHGGRLLVDGGPDPDRLLVALDERLPPWDRRIDSIVLTHPHEDHVAGLPLLLERYRVGRVFEPGMRGPGPSYAAWDAALSSRGAPPRGTLATGDRLAVDDVSLRVLWPDPGDVPVQPGDSGTAINDISIVLLGVVDGHRFLLTGDIEQDVDPSLVARGLPPVDVLKVAHHGSATASTEPFLDATRPRLAVISVGAGNPYGHPAAATIGRLGRLAGSVLRTDLDGSVTIMFDGPVMRVHASGPRRAAEAAPSVVTADAVGVPPGLGYHRLDDGPLSGGGGAPASVARPAGVARPPLARRGRDRRLARATCQSCGTDRTAGRPAAHGGRSPVARRRQGARTRAARRRPARPGRRTLAGRAGPSRAGRGRGTPSGHAVDPRRRGPLGPRRSDRGEDRGVRGQARRPEARADGRAVRVLDAALSRRLGA